MLVILDATLYDSDVTHQHSTRNDTYIVIGTITLMIKFVG
jgi:hypothetical protein